MTELRHLQLVILGIVKDIDELCRRNGIDYYLLGGSAIGAIRHKGFIPWDDDLDILLDSRNYERLVHACREQLDPKKYFVQEGLKDWPLHYTKLKLRGTRLTECENNSVGGESGIFVDIFRMDNVPDNAMAARWQYFCAKFYLCYQLACRGYRTATPAKRAMILLSLPLKLKPLRRFVRREVEKWNARETKRLGFFYGRTKFHTAITARDVYGRPRRVPFEDTQLPVPEKYHEYLTQMFGDYMQLPPVEQRKGLHLVSVDFGKY